MAKEFTLGKNERLKSRKQIDGLFNGGKKFTLAPFRVHYISGATEGSLLRFGIGVSSKVFRKAVERNRVKRLVRECWRLQKKELEKELIAANSTLQVFVIYTAKEIPGYGILYEKMEKMIGKLRSLLTNV